MLAKKAGRERRELKRGEDLHSRARRVVASTAREVVSAEGNLRRELSDGETFTFVRGLESIRLGVSLRDAKPPGLVESGSEYQLTRNWPC
jgi:hypothetical protein